jgi:hypothetical protein
VVKHKKIYLEYFGYGDQDMVPSEYSGLRAEHIHHLNGRISDEIWNLMAVTGEEHDRVHFPKPGEDGKAFNELLKRIHAEQLRLREYTHWKKALP